MKKLFIFLLAFTLIMAGGCGKKADVEKPQSEKPAATEKFNFERFASEAPDNTNLIVIVSPTDEQKSGIKVTDNFVLDEDGQEIYIMPKDAGSKIDIYSLTFNKLNVDLQKENKQFSAMSGENSCLLIKAIIPEGMPSSGVYVTTPGGEELSYIISYDGKGETNVYYR